MYTEKRKADREAMAAKLIEAVKIAGGDAEICDVLTDDREIHIKISTERGLKAGIDFDGQSQQPDNYCIPWHVRAFESDAKLSPSIFPGVNTYHYGKCTEFRNGFEALRDRVVEVIQAARTGEAFQH